jgi:hypothetical protein
LKQAYHGRERQGKGTHEFCRQRFCFKEDKNANGKYLLPGAIDPHVHYGVYTPINEASRTESRSAAVGGGVTTMIWMLRLYDSYSRDLSLAKRALLLPLNYQPSSSSARFT